MARSQGFARASNASAPHAPAVLAPVRQNSLGILSGVTHSAQIKVQLFANLAHQPLTAIHALIVHQTDSTTAAATLAEYKADAAKKVSGSRGGVGAHFLIDKDGTIYQTSDLTRRCWHIGPIISKCYERHACVPKQTQQYAAMSKLKPWSTKFVRPVDRIEEQKAYPDRYPDNADSLGIELVGKHLGDDTSTEYEKPTEKQQAALKWLVAQLLDAYGLQRTDVYRHPQVSRKNAGEARDAQW